MSSPGAQVWQFIFKFDFNSPNVCFLHADLFGLLFLIGMRTSVLLGFSLAS